MLRRMRFVLVHSPVAGRSTWRWVADALRSKEHEVIVPNLVAAALTGEPGRFAQAAAEATGSDEDTVIVGHSGAGAVLPLIAARLPSKPLLTIFVDAILPPCDGTFTPGAELLEMLRGLATSGVLPKWSQWWDEAVLDSLIPDDVRRREVEIELPPVPLAFYESPIEVPANWCKSAAAFVLLSEAYRPEATRAASLGWPVVERPGAHLDIVNDEEAIAETLVRLARP
jgi:pimeloyl-ACP methyl ester carboxylesterase